MPSVRIVSADRLGLTVNASLCAGAHLLSSVGKGMDKKKKRRPCPHQTPQSAPRKDISEYKQVKHCSHEDCKDATAVKLWLCMQEQCYYVGCGEDDKDHIERHATIQEHHIAMCIENGRLWCFACDSETFWNDDVNAVQPEHHHLTAEASNSDVDLGESVGMYNGPIGLLPAPGATVAASSTDDSDLPGLVGLKNLGNTCYMNAALQSLSNCEPLTRFMLDCGPAVILQARKSSLSKSYLKLLRELWGVSRSGVAVPSGVHQAIRLVNPAFRGYQQQDAQEFLRCFMDQLDEEMKQPLVTHSAASGEGKDNDSMEGAHNMSSGGDMKDRQVKSYRSIVGDIFDGKILSSVRCYKCDQISSVRESFQDLSLPIPGHDQLQVLRGGSANAVTGSGQVLAIKPLHSSAATGASSNSGGSTSMLRYLTPTFWFSLTTSLLKWAMGDDVTLNDCLAALFSEDELKGDNMYSCEHCKKLRNSVKSVKVLQLPEILCIHLKRFRHDSMLSSKISSYVSFPLTDLEMAPYRHKDCVSSATMYDLVAVICHHGSVGGGHYTSYCKSYHSGYWYEFDDQYVTRVSPQTVESCQAYVLFYRKQRSRQSEKCHAEFAVELGNSEPSLLKFFISKRWLLKFQSFSEPGPITNSDFLCVHGGVAPKNAVIIEEHAIALPQALWSFLYKAYGGGPAVNRLYRCKICEDAAKALHLRQETEMDTFVKLNKARRVTRSVAADRSDVSYAISNSWFRQWEDFATGKAEDPPGPITNQPISMFKNGEHRLRYNSDFCQLSLETWDYLHSIYGGGPVLRQIQCTSSSSTTRSSGASLVTSPSRDVEPDSLNIHHLSDGGSAVVSSATAAMLSTSSSSHASSISIASKTSSAVEEPSPGIRESMQAENPQADGADGLLAVGLESTEQMPRVSSSDLSEVQDSGCNAAALLSSAEKRQQQHICVTRSQTENVNINTPDLIQGATQATGGLSSNVCHCEAAGCNELSCGMTMSAPDRHGCADADLAGVHNGDRKLRSASVSSNHGGCRCRPSTPASGGHEKCHSKQD